MKKEMIDGDSGGGGVKIYMDERMCVCYRELIHIFFSFNLLYQLAVFELVFGMSNCKSFPYKFQLKKNKSRKRVECKSLKLNYTNIEQRRSLN